jgi:hypothetical protein
MYPAGDFRLLKQLGQNRNCPQGPARWGQAICVCFAPVKNIQGLKMQQKQDGGAATAQGSRP